MRILILEDESQMGGVQHSTLNFLAGLPSKADVEALLLLPEAGPFSEACEVAGIPFQYYPKITLHPSSISFAQDRFRLPNLWGLIKNLLRSKSQAKALLPIIKTYKPDVVLTKGMGAHINGGKACQQLDIPCVWHQQDFISERYGGAYRYLFGWLARRYAHYLIADGNPIRDQLPRDMQKRCAVIFNGVPLDSFYQPTQKQSARTVLGIPEQAYVVGHLARLTPWKGQHLLIQAFAEYAKSNLNAHLLLIGSPLFEGEDYLPYLQQLIEKLGIAERVHLPGYRTDLGFVLSGIDTFIYPSVEKDTSPLALISAMAAGLPVGVSDISGLREMVEGCAGAHLFKNRDIPAIKSVMTHFEDPRLRQQAGRANREWSQDHFSQEAYTQQLLTTLRSNL
ncbi:glycosyltransferase family 4 protein [Phaeodactylibacter xiamenensis]|uniref:glycosyltransferase family 4 protein n=1 Tax=Phaeodactylibacter xiamenensis TaxID=1524460 RepID=UPI003CCBB649